MSSLFDVPAQLVIIFTLAASGTDATVNEAGVLAASRHAAPQSRQLEFSEQVWFEAVRCGAGGNPMAGDAARIFRTTSGRYYVPTENDRHRILSKRGDDELALRLAAGFARCNAGVLSAALGRNVTAGELFLAHRFGSSTALALINAAAATPKIHAGDVIPDAGSRLTTTTERRMPVGELVMRMKQLLERGPNGVEVARWFEDGPRLLQGGELKGAIAEAPEVDRDQAPARHALASQDWTAEVDAVP